MLISLVNDPQGKQSRRYFIPDNEYYEKVPNIAQKDALDQASNKQKVQPAAGMIDGTGGKKMIYGPFIQHGVAFDSIEDKNAEYIPEVTERSYCRFAG